MVKIGAAKEILTTVAKGKFLKAINIDASEVTDVIITHLHYDHAGGLMEFPKAKFHMQEVEMAYATGPCMCHDTIKMPFTGEHVCQYFIEIGCEFRHFNHGAITCT